MSKKHNRFTVTFVRSIAVGFHCVDKSDPKVTKEFVPDREDLAQFRQDLESGIVAWRVETKIQCKDQVDKDNPKKAWRRVFVTLHEPTRIFDGNRSPKKTKAAQVVEHKSTKPQPLKNLIVVNFNLGRTNGAVRDWSLTTNEEQLENGKITLRKVVWSFADEPLKWQPVTNKVLLCEILGETLLKGTNFVGRKLRLIGPGLLHIYILYTTYFHSLFLADLLEYLSFSTSKVAS